MDQYQQIFMHQVVGLASGVHIIAQQMFIKEQKPVLGQIMETQFSDGLMMIQY